MTHEQEKTYLAIKNKQGLFFTRKKDTTVNGDWWSNSLQDAKLYPRHDLLHIKRLAYIFGGEVVEVTVVFNG